MVECGRETRAIVEANGCEGGQPLHLYRCGCEEGLVLLQHARTPRQHARHKYVRSAIRWGHGGGGGEGGDAVRLRVARVSHRVREGEGRGNNRIGGHPHNGRHCVVVRRRGAWERERRGRRAEALKRNARVAPRGLRLLMLRGGRAVEATCCFG